MHHSHLALAQPGRAGGPACALPAEVARFLRCRPAPLPPSRPPRARNTALRVLPQPPHNASPKYLAEVLKIFHNEWKGGKSFPAVRRAARPPPPPPLPAFNLGGRMGGGGSTPGPPFFPRRLRPCASPRASAPPPPAPPYRATRAPRAVTPRRVRVPRGTDPSELRGLLWGRPPGICV